MTHPLVEQLRFARSEWRRALRGIPEAIWAMPSTSRLLPIFGSRSRRRRRHGGVWNHAKRSESYGISRSSGSLGPRRNALK